MSRNGEINETFGVYKTVCCDAEIVIGVGGQFPDCPNHKNLSTKWKHLPEIDPSTRQEKSI